MEIVWDIIRGRRGDRESWKEKVEVVEGRGEVLIMEREKFYILILFIL